MIRLCKRVRVFSGCGIMEENVPKKVPRLFSGNAKSSAVFTSEEVDLESNVMPYDGLRMLRIGSAQKRCEASFSSYLAQFKAGEVDDSIQYLVVMTFAEYNELCKYECVKMNENVTRSRAELADDWYYLIIY